MESKVNLSVIDKAPLLFSLGKWMQRHKVPGGTRLLNDLERLGYLKGKVVRYRLKGDYHIVVPTFGTERWDWNDVAGYESELMNLLVQTAGGWKGDATIIDCGADIGLVSVTLAASMPAVKKIIAFEPNNVSYACLQKTLSRLPIEAEALHMAISDFSGYGRMVSPPYDASSHAAYLAPDESGDLVVRTLNSVRVETPNLLLKIDVEGGELAVIRGALELLARSAAVIVSIEAHPKVSVRTGIDPIAVLRQLVSVRSFKFVIAEEPTIELDLTRPFFEQMPVNHKVYNVVCSSS